MGHFAMRGRVIVEEEAGYNSWIATQKTFAQTVAENSVNLNRGQALYTVCASCHGQQGQGNVALNAPRLGGMDEWYLESQLLKFKNGMRGTHTDDVYGKQMVPMVATLTSASAVKDVSAYIATLAGAESENTIIGDVNNGRRLFTTCGVCHGKEGQGVWSVNAPRLTGINDWYLARQLSSKASGAHILLMPPGGKWPC